MPIQTSSNNITFNGLSNNVSYTFTVTATNSYGTSDISVDSSSVIPRDSPSIVNIYNDNNKNYSLVGTSSINITIIGTNFYEPILTVTSITNGINIQITNLTVVSTTQITCSIQNIYSDTFNFNILDIGGNTVFNSGYTFYNPPSINNISPNSGSSVGGTFITITGTNLIYINNIKFDNNDITIYDSSSTELKFKTLPYNTNINPIIEISLIGITIQTNLFSFILPPILTSTNPTTDTQLTIIGTNFNDVSVFIDNIPITNVDIINDTTLIINDYLYSPTDNIQIQSIGGQIEFVNNSSTETYIYPETTITSITTE